MFGAARRSTASLTNRPGIEPRFTEPGVSGAKLKMDNNIYVGIAKLEVHIPEARSLKQKRSSTRKLVDRIRTRHQVLVIESDRQDLYQRAGFAISALSTDPVDVESRLRRVENTVHETWSGNVLDWDVEIIQI